MNNFAEEHERCDFEPLPVLLEDEENVSLADVLSLQDSCLTEQDIWAICLECSQSLKSIAHSAIFQTLCITPDTLAFNTNGNVCFMEQISDDPEGAFVAPEIDVTGNTFEAVISLCKEKLKLSSSNDICKNFSVIGRRVLSIESGGTFQDSCDNLWKEKVFERISPCEQYTKENNGKNENSFLEDLKVAGCRNFSKMQRMNDQKDNIKEIQINMVKERFCCQRISTQLTECIEGKSNLKYKKCKTLDTEPYTNELEGDVFKKNCMRKIKTFPKLPSESPSDPSTIIPLIMHSRPLSRKQPLKPESLSVINNNEHTVLEGKLIQCNSNNQLGSKAGYFQGPNVNLEELCLRTKVSPVYQHCMRTCDDGNSDLQHSPTEISTNSGTLNGPDDLNSNPQMLDNCKAWKYCNETSPESNETCFLHVNRMLTVLTAPNDNEYGPSLHSLPELNPIEMKDCCIEDKQAGDRESEMKTNEQWVFLKHLLAQYGKPLKDYELWALCYECLLTLETYTDYPAYLCLDSVLISSDGSVLFAPPESKDSYDMFYLAPELAEDDSVTEKVCIYYIAAILWRAAKYNFPPDHKLVLPRKLKNFLLDMARKKSEDRPSLADAIKTCDSYLLEQDINSKEIVAFVTKSAFQAFREEIDCFQDSLPFDFQRQRDSVADNLGFLPISNESKLIAVRGPVPCQLSLNRESTMLPTAFTSPATHFKPIVLHQNTLKTDTVASTSEQCETTMEEVLPVDSKKSVVLNVDTESQTDEDFGVSSDILKHDEQVSKMLLQTPLQEQYPKKTDPPMAQLPLLSNSACDAQEKCTSPSSSISNCTVSSSMTFINNFLLKQDPETRVLTLVPVQIAISEQIPNKPLHSKAAYSCCPSLHVLLSDAVVSYKANETLQSNVQNECGEIKVNNLSANSTNKETQTVSSERNPFLKFCADTVSNTPLSDHLQCTSVDQNPCSLSIETFHQNKDINEDLLKEVVHLIQEELAFGSYMENTTEGLTIGKYIFSLKDLKYNTFCNAISEKFCNHYWEEELLAKLYNTANGKASPSVSMNKTEYCDKNFQSLNSLLDASDETKVSTPTTFADMDIDDLPQDNIENRPQIAVAGTEMEGECLQMNKSHLSPEFPEENLEQEDVPGKTEENIYIQSPCPFELHGFCPDWKSAFYGSECFGLEVHSYVRKLGKWQANGTQNPDAKRVELEQLIMIETKNYRKSLKFYQRLLHKERRSKGCETKATLPRLRGQLEEMKSKVQFLELVKKYLQIMYIEKWGVEPCDLPTVVNMGRSETLDISSLDSMLLFYNINKAQYKAQYNDNQNQPRNLQTGTPLGLMTYLYSRNAFLEGYVQQFLSTFRYFCTQEELLQFLLDRIRITLCSSNLGSCLLLSKIYYRSFSILQTWIEDCFIVDFAIKPDLMSTLKDFITSKVAPLSGYGKQLLSLIEGITSRKQNNVSQCYKLEDWEEEEEEEEDGETKSLRALCKRISKEVSQKSFNWKLLKGNEAVAPYRRHRQYSIASAVPKSCYTNLAEEFSSFYTKIDGPYFLTEYTPQQLCCQLTLLEQDMFLKCHPVHFLNSRLLGVKDKSMSLQKATSSELLSTQVCNLFVQNCVQDNYLLQLLKYADNVSTWAAAEIVTSCSSKEQVNLLSQFLFIAKCCYEQRNFATAIQILRGLENLIVRQLPVWKYLPSRISEIMEELKAVEVFLKSDSLCLMKGERFKTSPTIPAAHVLAMHIQQLETGGFTMRNGTYKWTKLRNIAKVVSQVHAFQENPYTFTPDHQLQSCLRHRIASFSDADVSALAADNYANFHQIPAGKQSRKIQDTLHRMKAMFQ
ncbi:kinase non-catalytic C-lobe domain-containing protein 1 isoform X2 [Hemicordylus capensis]|uniref:kinase non-catalytic C-lobe domain-containing protein 1 isoform X2 n=1 Tax=Hemicordylus capensis TaxID=884348 RepID=UPI0023022581|nr:kinase non-catalytic C-lobe domain-containing protein 1 isoform X2 [Hemicordylus capensis]